MSNNELVRYELGSGGDGSELNSYYPFTTKQICFIEAYAELFDEAKAAEQAGYSNPQQAVQLLRKNEAVMRELCAIQQARFKATRMTAEMASAKHIDLMRKFEHDYDASKLKDKAKMANSLAKMSGDYLRASGLFDKEGEKKSSNIIINIDLGEKKEEIVINGECKECEDEV